MNYKRLIQKSFIGKHILPIRESIINFVCDKKREPLVAPLAKTIFSISFKTQSIRENSCNNLSIISSNCFAGRIMQDLKMEYNSPTLGLYFMYPDYIDFLQNLEFYLKKARIQFVEHSKYPIGDERRANWKHWYPIGLLDGKIEIHFLHYHSEEEAAEKWYRRASRVNMDNLLIVGMQQNLCTEKDIEAFDKLPFENKIMFSTLPLNLRSNEYMPEFAGLSDVGDAYRKSDVFYNHLITHFSKY